MPSTFNRIRQLIVRKLTVRSDAQVNGNLTVSGTSTLTGNSTVGGTLGVTGAITATGGVTGAITGNADTATVATDVKPVAAQVLSADGAITIPSNNERFAYVAITKGSAAAITLATPVAGDEGKEILVYAETAQLHQITCPDGFNAKGSSGTMTNAAAADNYFRLIARNLHWRIIDNVGFTKA